MHLKGLIDLQRELYHGYRSNRFVYTTAKRVHIALPKHLKNKQATHEDLNISRNLQNRTISDSKQGGVSECVGNRGTEEVMNCPKLCGKIKCECEK